MIDRRRFIVKVGTAAVAGMAAASPALAKARARRGRFFDYPVQGLGYRATPSGLSGSTDRDGMFDYEDGDAISFLIGGMLLGTASAAAWLTPLDLVPEAKGDVKHPRLTNVGMLIQSLDASGNIEGGILLTPAVHKAVAGNAKALDLDQPPPAFFRQLNDLVVAELVKSAAFGPATGGAIKNANPDGTRAPRSIEMVRNQLRRTQAGIMRLTDVKIPMRDYDAATRPDAYLLGTLHLPVGPTAPARAPVALNLGVYGKDRIFGSVCTPDALQAQEIVDDRYRDGNPDHKPYENHETVDTFAWVPAGYAVLRVDEAGIGRSPGKLDPWSAQTASDYIDVIQWAGRQRWSNGRVGTIGISYYAMNQWQMAAKAEGVTALRAMIPWEGGVDTYRDDMYPGGLFLEDFFRMWAFQNNRNHCGPPTASELHQQWGDHPFFDDDFWKDSTADLSQVTVPFLSAVGLDNMALHPRGNAMAFRFAKSRQKLLRLNTGSHISPFYSKEGVADQMAFFDYWLKGVDTGIMRKPPVKMAIKTGDERGFYWSYARQFPLPQMRYTKFYLDARPELSGFRVDGTMPVYQLHPSGDVVTERHDPVAGAPPDAAVATYSAVVQPVTQVRGPPPPKFIRPQAANSYGISFATPPLAETITLAGYAKLVVWVSSSTEDMDLHVSLRVYDEHGVQLIYSTDQEERIDLPEKPPIQQGRLKVSHRKLDAARSSFFQPVHTHREADYQPLKPGEIVPVEVEFWPLTAEIRKGCRIVIDVQPYHGEGHAWPHRYGAYNRGTNSIHTGPQHISYVQLPIVPGIKPAGDGERWSIS